MIGAYNRPNAIAVSHSIVFLFTAVPITAVLTGYAGLMTAVIHTSLYGQVNIRTTKASAESLRTLSEALVVLTYYQKRDF